MKKVNNSFHIFKVIIFILVFSNLSLSQWEQTSGMYQAWVRSFAKNGNIILAGTSDSIGVYQSTNNGQSWTQRTINYWVSSLAISGNIFFAGTIDGVFLSSNNGQNWMPTALINKNVISLVINNNIIFAGTAVFSNPSGIYLSTNNGQNWTQTTLNNKIVNALVNSGNNIFAGTDNTGVYLSTDNGQTWAQTALNNRTIYSLIISGNNIFAGSSDYSNPTGVYLSTNNGQNWTQTALNNKFVHSLAASGNNIFAGTDNSGIYFSSNNGQNWTQKNEGFSTIVDINSLIIVNEYILAGTYCKSVWRRPLSDFVGIQNVSSEIPSDYSLKQNYPNPFNPSTNIRYQISNNKFVTLKVYDLLGKEVAILVNENQKPGTYEVTLDESLLPSGIYFYRLEAGDFSQTRKMILIK